MIGRNIMKNIPAKYKKTGDFIRKLLDKKGASQKDLADFLKRTHSVVSKLCSGQIRPTPEVLTGLVDFFGVSADDILRGGFIVKSSDDLSDKTEIETIFCDRRTERKIPMVDQSILDRLLTQIEKKDDKIDRLTSEINHLRAEISAMLIKEGGGDPSILEKLSGGDSGNN